MLARLWRYTIFRNFSNSAVRTSLEKKSAETSASSDSSSLGFVSARKPSNLEKRMLVFSGSYKTVEEIPKFVKSEVIESSKTKIRVKIANLMILVVLIACGTIIYNGKALKKERIRNWQEEETARRAEEGKKEASEHH